MATSGLSVAQLAELAKYDTPTVCNAIELFDVRPRNEGFMDCRITACFPKLPPMVGYALTTTFRSAAPSSGDSYGELTDQVERYSGLPGAPIMVFQDTDDPAVAATFGEVMCTTYKAFGSAGLITSGGGRDIEQVEAINYPVFVGSKICAHGYCHFTSIGEDVRVGGLVVRTGDLLHGDMNGVTNIPHEIASEVADACQALVDAEQAVLEYVKGSSVTIAGFKEAHTETVRMLVAARKRFSRAGK